MLHLEVYSLKDPVPPNMDLDTMFILYHFHWTLDKT